jgi:hypothetical protein
MKERYTVTTHGEFQERVKTGRTECSRVECEIKRSRRRSQGRWNEKYGKSVTQSGDEQWREVKEMGGESFLLNDSFTVETCKDRGRRNMEF